MIDIQNIYKTFQTGDVQTIALNDITLTIPTGDFLMIMGPSGCGKTTLLSVLAGILKPDSGKCIINGIDFNQGPEHELLSFRAQSVGFIFQNFNLIPTLSVLENIAIPLFILGYNRQNALDEAQKMLDRVGLHGRGSEQPQHLSGGQQQRVAIARSMVHKPKFLICDEPTSALDHALGQSIIELMKEMNCEYKMTTIIVTHDQRIVHYADHMIEMEDGQIIRRKKK